MTNTVLTVLGLPLIAAVLITLWFDGGANGTDGVTYPSM